MAGASVNYYFRSKDQLYEAAFAKAFEKFASGLAEAVAEASGFEQILRAVIEHFARFYADHPDAVRLWMQENLAGGQIAAHLIKEGDGEFALEAFIDAYREAETAGRVRSVDPYHLFVSVMGACLMLPIGRPTLQATLPPYSEQPEEFEADRADAIFDLIWHGLAHEA